MFYTYDPTLDAMLGLDQKKNNGLKPGSIILLRGGPGSAKTTLSLQILRNHIAKNGNSSAVFVSLEVDPQAALDHVGVFDFDFEKPDRKPRLISRDDVVGYLKTRQAHQIIVGLEATVLEFAPAQQNLWVSSSGSGSRPNV